MINHTICIHSRNCNTCISYDNHIVHIYNDNTTTYSNNDTTSGSNG